MPIDSVIDGITIDKSRVCRFLGYLRGQNLTASASSLIDLQIEEAQGLIQPSHSFVVRKVLDAEISRTFIEGAVVFTSNVITSILSRCHEVAIFTATVGAGLEERVSQLMGKGEMLKAVVLDAVGSAAIEKVACELEENVRKKAMTGGAEISRRYSPGYCDWDIKEQKLLFDTLNGDSAGVELTEGYLMMPQKSISGVIGISFDQTITVSTCLSCSNKDCEGRRI
jgi:hypothetical protein